MDVRLGLRTRKKAALFGLSLVLLYYAAALSSADITTDLVLALRFENSSVIGEDNTHVSDYRGNGLNGTKSAGGQYFNGLFNGFLNNSCVNIPDNNLLDMREQYSMSVWINLPGGAMSTYYLIQKGDGDRYDFLWYSGREDRITHFTTGGGNIDSTGGGLNNSNWVHLTGTYNISTGLKTYVNGVLNASLAPTTTNITVGVAGLGIGCGYVGDAIYAGALDEFRLYNRTLTAEEVADLYAYNSTAEEEVVSSSSSSSSSSSIISADSDASSTSSSSSSSSSFLVSTSSSEISSSSSSIIQVSTSSSESSSSSSFASSTSEPSSSSSLQSSFASSFLSSTFASSIATSSSSSSSSSSAPSHPTTTVPQEIRLYMQDQNTVFSVNNANATNESTLDMSSDYFLYFQNAEYNYFDIDNAISLGWIFIVSVLGILFIVIVLSSAAYALWGAGKD